MTLVSGPTALAAPFGVECIDVRSAAQMFDAVKRNVAGCDVFIAVAAVADYRVRAPSAQKIKKGAVVARTLDLVENPDILAHVARMKKPPFCVGFAAESEDLERNAKAKRAKKGIPLLAANLAQSALGADENAITLYDDRGRHSLGRGPKLQQARQMVAHIASMLPKRKP